MKNKFIYNEELIVSNIEEVFIQSTSSVFKEAKLWYPTARNYAMDFSQEFNIPFVKCCALISVLSPQKEWFHNLQLTKDFLKSGGRKARHTSVQIQKARDIYNFVGNYKELDTIIGGRKTVNFFHNIHSPSNPMWVTIDTHMIEVCMGNFDRSKLTVNQYDFLAEILKNQAKVHNLASSEYQSILWLTWKSIKPRWGEKK